MHPEVNSFAHTLVKEAGHLVHGMPPALNGRAAILLIFLVQSLIGAGCTSTSPRYTSGGPRLASAEARASGKTEDEGTGPEPAGFSNRAERVRPAAPSRENNSALNRHTVLSDIMGMMGVPYSEGGSGSAGTDCSGFTATVYRVAIRREIPRSCRGQYDTGVPVDQAKLRFGDLVFFNIDGHPLSHVGIYVGDGLFAHASVSLGITVSLLEAEYYKRWYAGARRIVR